MDKKKDKKKFLLGFIIGGLIFGSISTYAATVLAEDVSFNVNVNSSGQANNVKAALDELYNQIGPKYRGTTGNSESYFEKSWDAVNNYDMVVKNYTDGNATADQWFKNGLCLMSLSSDEQDCFEANVQGVQKAMELFGNNNCDEGEGGTTCYDAATETTCNFSYYYSEGIDEPTYNEIYCYYNNTECSYSEYSSPPKFVCSYHDSGGEA